MRAHDEHCLSVEVAGFVCFFLLTFISNACCYSSSQLHAYCILKHQQKSYSTKAMFMSLKVLNVCWLCLPDTTSLKFQMLEGDYMPRSMILASFVSSKQPGF